MSAKRLPLLTLLLPMASLTVALLVVMLQAVPGARASLQTSAS